MNITARELAALIDGRVEGDFDKQVTTPAKIEEATKEHITFLGNLKYEDYLYQNQPGIVIVNTNFVLKSKVSSTLIRVDDVYSAVQNLLSAFHPEAKTNAGIDPSANLADDVEIGDKVRIGPLSYVGAGSKIGAGTNIHPQVYVGDRVKIGQDVILYPGVRIYNDTVIGDRCIVHANTVIGSDGFGYAKSDSGEFEKIPHIGNVILEEDVEIGSNTSVDRAVMGSTVLKKGVKLDNLIQIAHNVVVGERTGIAALTGVAGSAKIGSDCLIGGQVGIMGHTHIANGVQIQAQTGVISSIKDENTKWAGTPSMNYFDFLRSSAVFKNLSQLKKEVDTLVKQAHKK